VRASRVLPYGTLVVNVSGALVLGFLTGLALDERIALLAGTALVGSYTTFSTWMFETQRLAEDRQVSGLVGNIVVSLVAGIAAASRERVETLLDALRHVDHRGLLTLERARMIRDDIGPVVLPEDLHEATKLTVYVGRQEHVYRTPAFLAVCDLLHRRGIAG